MNTATATNRITENAEKKWESPILANLNRENAAPRLSLSVKPSGSSRLKGLSVNRFLLKEEKEEALDSQETIRVKRQQLKALFEAGAN